MREDSSSTNNPLVLVADDDPAMRLLMKESLVQEGFAVKEAADGVKALDVVRQMQPDLILLDLMMPGMDGYTVLSHLRKTDETANTPVMVVTSLEDTDDVRRAYEAGATDFLTKPIHWPNLGNHARYLIRANQVFSELLKSEEKFRSLAENLGEVIYQANPVTHETTFVNQAIEDLYGYTAKEWLADPQLWEKSIHPDDVERVFAALESSERKREPFTYEYRIRRRDGSVRWVEDRVSWENGTGMSSPSVNGVVYDITERQRTNEKLLLAQEVFENSAQLIAITDPRGMIIDANPAFMKLTGYDRSEVLGRNIGMMKSPQQDTSLYHDHASSLHQHGFWQGEIKGRKKNGKLFSCLMTINAVKNEKGETTHYVNISTDISRLKEFEDQLRHMAYFDTLTDLPNRFLLDDRLQQAIYEAERDEQMIAVLFLDLDNFKDINDSLGHRAGDQLLMETARRLQHHVRRSDTVAHMSGDEFIIVLRNLSDADTLPLVIEEHLSTLKKPFELEGRDFFLTTSVGIALYPSDGDNPEDLIKNADIAMYHAKRHGKNHYQFFSAEMNASIRQRLDLKSALRQGLAKNEFLVHYQPKIDLLSGSVTGVEALLRWERPGHGLISPAMFIPMAEETGIISEIGEQALGMACRQIRQWQQQALPPLTVAVNLSAVQLRKENLTSTIRNILEDADLPSCWLELEITESVVMHDTAKAITILNELKAMGIRVTMDDFGTGYSSLSYLKRFPISSLKIDRSFIADLFVTPDNAEITRAIIAMAQRLKLDIVAEGVETKEQLDFLRQEGCNQIQGYYFARPMPASDFEQWLRDWEKTRAERFKGREGDGSGSEG